MKGDIYMKKTKIICTIGPATNNKEMLKKLIFAGMNVVRINLSHADHSFAEDVINNIRALNSELKTNVGILFDTKGSDLRIESYREESVNVENGDQIVITNKGPLSDNGKFFVDYCNLIDEVKKGDKILLGDGNIQLIVVDNALDDLICEVQNKGAITHKMRLNIPGVNLGMDFLSPDDKDDITFAAEKNIDFIALSYVRNANDVLDVNDMLIKLKNEHMQIIAKIESKSAVEDIDNIIKVSDGLMVARGDLGIEIDLEKVPRAQKEIVRKSYDAHKFCIVATQMLASMEENPRPTRAEVSDVANAVIDGVDAVMLSGETAVGKYPLETVEMMTKIIEDTEDSLDYEDLLHNHPLKNTDLDITTVIAHNVVDSANALKAKAIVVSSISGYTARKVSLFRPSCIILVTTPNELTACSLALQWGVKAIIVDMFNSTDQIIDNAIRTAKEAIPLEGEKIIITGGFPIDDNKNTNFIKIEEIPSSNS